VRSPASRRGGGDIAAIAIFKSYRWSVADELEGRSTISQLSGAVGEIITKFCSEGGEEAVA